MKALKTGLKIIVGGTVLVGTFITGIMIGTESVGIAIAKRHPISAINMLIKANDDVATLDEHTNEACHARIVKRAFDGRF